jgi:hypothetical protein
MTQLTEQLSAVRNAQLDIFRALTTRALDSAGQLFALNMKVSRQSVEQAAGAFRNLLDARDPRDLLAVGTAAQGQWQNLFSYGREVFGIATGAPVLNWIGAPLPSPVPQLLPTPAPAAAASVVRVIEDAANAAVDAEPQAAAPAVDKEAVAEAEAAVDAAIADDVPPASANPVAKALQEIAPLPASAEHPIAAPVFLDAGGEVELPAVDPVDSTPPVRVSAGPATKPARGSRKK